MHHEKNLKCPSGEKVTSVTLPPGQRGLLAALGPSHPHPIFILFPLVTVTFSLLSLDDS